MGDLSPPLTLEEQRWLRRLKAVVESTPMGLHVTVDGRVHVNRASDVDEDMSPVISMQGRQQVGRLRQPFISFAPPVGTWDGGDPW